jgi:hypothetical protein
MSNILYICRSKKVEMVDESELKTISVVKSHLTL